LNSFNIIHLKLIHKNHYPGNEYMNEHPFIVTKESAILKIDLNRPNAGNALTMPMLNELRLLIEQASIDPLINVVSIVARGDHFCTGRDNTGHKREGMSVLQVHDQVMGKILGFYAAIRNCSIPVACSVQGDAKGFGCALAGSADFTFASSSASFKLDEIEHGSPSTLAMSALVNKLPRKALSWLVCSGKPLDAMTAQTLGLVSCVYDSTQFDKNSTEAIELIASRPRIALQTVKKFLNRAPGLDPEMASDFAGALHAMVRTK